MKRVAKLAVEIAGDKMRQTGLRGSLENIQVLGRMLQAGLSGHFRISWKTLSLIGAGLLYVFCPFDAVADIIPVAGQLDDAAVVSVIVASLKELMSSFLAWEAEKGVVIDVG